MVGGIFKAKIINKESDNKVCTFVSWGMGFRK